MTRVEDGLDLLEGATGRFGEHEEDVDECEDVEASEEDVHSPSDVGQTGRSAVSESKVEDPVGSSGEGDGLCAL